MAGKWTMTPARKAAYARRKKKGGKSTVTVEARLANIGKSRAKRAGKNIMKMSTNQLIKRGR